MLPSSCIITVDYMRMWLGRIRLILSKHSFHLTLFINDCACFCHVKASCRFCFGAKFEKGGVPLKCTLFQWKVKVLLMVNEPQMQVRIWGSSEMEEGLIGSSLLRVSELQKRNCQVTLYVIQNLWILFCFSPTFVAKSGQIEISFIRVHVTYFSDQ